MAACLTHFCGQGDFHIDALLTCQPTKRLCDSPSYFPLTFMHSFSDLYLVANYFFLSPKVIKDVCSNCTGTVDSDGPLSSSPVHKTELEKVKLPNQ